MSDCSTFSTRFVDQCATMLHLATVQRRTALRILLLTIGLVLVPGRTMVSRMLVALGLASGDWTAAYRVFSTPRVRLSILRREVIRQWLALYPADAPVIVVVDGTQLPRTGRKIPGVGFARHPRTPAWKPGIHRAQRWQGVSGLTPPTETGDCRAVPLWFEPDPSPSARAWPTYPSMPEWQAAIRGLQDVRATIDRMASTVRSLVVVGDGAYSGAGVWNGLPDHTTMIARCARNRVLRHLPEPESTPRRGRKRLYGVRGPSPQAHGQDRSGRQRLAVMVRGKVRHLSVGVSGPWLLEKAPQHPLFLLTIGGIGRQVGKRTHQRDMMHFLVNAQNDDGGWVLPYPVHDLVMWVWQRWEVEVMHRELKSGWGLGDQQQWSPTAAVTVTQWVVWAYAVLILTGTTGPPPPVRTTSWYRSRRWTPRDLTHIIRHDLWLAPPRPLTAGSPPSGTTRPQNTALRVLLAVADAI